MSDRDLFIAIVLAKISSGAIVNFDEVRRILTALNKELDKL